MRGISAVGSAQHWQCWGQGFESPMLHQNTKTVDFPRFFVYLQHLRHPRFVQTVHTAHLNARHTVPEILFLYPNMYLKAHHKYQKGEVALSFFF